MMYKPEIDGLRAVAVLLVLLCHLGLLFPGGYIGVDVFFVISGFLITGIVINDIEQGRFNIFQFYARRLVRLYPALLVVVALTFVAGFILADPTFLETIARSGKYAIGSMSNIYFSKNLGYFDTAASQQPFLHTWTLGVEWQFYILAPVIIWVLLKHSKEALIIGLALVVGVSLVLSQTKVQANPDKAYYLVAYRAFELGIGGLLVFLYKKNCARPISIVLTVAGLCMIITAGLVYKPQTPFPGYAALLPTIGAALCIYGGQSYIKGNILRWAPMVYLGKISYSVYLVHWPLIVFAHYIFFYRDITIYDKLVILVLSLFLGFLLYKLIETKITWKKVRNKIGVCLGIVVISILGIVTVQYVYKHPEKLRWRISGLNRPVTVFDQKNYPELQQLGAPDGEAYAILLADSMGYNYARGFDEQLQDEHKFIYSFFRGGCYMLDRHHVFNMASQIDECTEKNRQAFDFLESNELPLILAQAWEYKYNLINLENNQRIWFDIRDESYKDFLRERLAALRQLLGNRKLILIGSPPYKLTGNAGREYFRPSCLNRPDFMFDLCQNFVGEDYKVEDSSVWGINEVVKAFAQTHPNTYYIDPAPVICPDGICNTRRNDEFFKQNDMNHFTGEGSSKVAPYIWAEVHKILRD